MKLQKCLLALIILFYSFQISFGQENPEAREIDEMGQICSEDLMARLDNFFIQLRDEPTAKGYVIFYGNNSVEGRNLNLISYITEFYPNRRIDKSRLSLLRGENRNQTHTEFWLVPAGANPPKPENAFVEEKYTSATLFDKTWADFNKAYGKMGIYENGFMDLGCDFSPNREEFAKVLLSNTQLIGYLIVYTEFGKSKKYGDKILKFALNELVKQYKIPQNQIKTMYGGNRNQPEIEFWLAPTGITPPIPTPDKSK